MNLEGRDTFQQQHLPPILAPGTLELDGPMSGPGQHVSLGAQNCPCESSHIKSRVDSSIESELVGKRHHWEVQPTGQEQGEQRSKGWCWGAKEKAREIAAIEALQNFYVQELSDDNDKGHGETSLEIVLIWPACPHFSCNSYQHLFAWLGGVDRTMGVAAAPFPHAIFPLCYLMLTSECRWWQW